MSDPHSTLPVNDEAIPLFAAVCARRGHTFSTPTPAFGSGVLTVYCRRCGVIEGFARAALEAGER